MSSKILMPQLVAMLAASTGTPKKQAEAFLKAYFAVIADTLGNHEQVKIKDFGTFKVNRVEARKSVNVSTGGEVRIPPHFKVVFTPAKQMADKVNKEFAWLDIVEISENVSNNELEAPTVDNDDNIAGASEVVTAPKVDTIETTVLEVAPVIREEIIATHDEKTITATEKVIGIEEEIVEPVNVETDIVVPVEAITREEEERSEKLGEELEKDFGEVEPVEPFGPVDPDDPMPGQPIPENSAPLQNVRQANIIPEGVPVEKNINEVTSSGELTDGEVISSPQHINVDKDFDPYAIETSTPPEPQIPESPYYITKDDIGNLATKSDFRIVAKNIKKIKAGLEEIDTRAKKRSRKMFAWSLVFSAALVIGGFFLTYWILLNNLSSRGHQAAEYLETELKEEIDEESYALATLSHAENRPKEEVEPVVEETPAKEAKREETSSTAPTTPSDIKAMDRITDTRYLTTMAKEHYGNYNLWPYIYLENESKLGHPDRIKPGTVVVIPNVDKYNIDPSNPKDIEKARKLGVEIYKKYAKD